MFKHSSVSIHKRRNFFALTSEENYYENLSKWMKNFTKVLFVRDPFERMFSGYIDKVFAPYSACKGPKKRHKRNRYGNVTLTELAQRMIHGYKNRHFVLQSKICPICNINYTFIGKFETFMKDVMSLMRKFHINMTSILGSQQRLPEKNDLSIMKDVIQRSFQGCIKSKENHHHYITFVRLWKVFQVKNATRKIIILIVITTGDTPRWDDQTMIASCPTWNQYFVRFCHPLSDTLPVTTYRM